MKKYFILFIAVVCLTSCYTDEDKKNLQRDCFELSEQKYKYQQEITSLNQLKAELNKEIVDLRNEKNILNCGREPQYVLKIEIKQGTFTLNPFEHVKNEVNAIEIEIPVSREFYNRVSIGTDLTDKFKAGSFWIDGDLSWLHLKIINKRIE